MPQHQRAASGLFIFTLEHDEGESAGLREGDDGGAPGYRLPAHGRYAHGRGYVERLLVGAGFELEIGQAELRMESGVSVAGLLVRAVLAGPRLGYSGCLARQRVAGGAGRASPVAAWNPVVREAETWSGKDARLCRSRLE